MKPTIGRIVIYNTTEKERLAMQSLRFNNIQKQLPAVIVAVWGEVCVNLKVFMDGGDQDLWKTSVNLGDNEGDWNWPVMQK